MRLVLLVAAACRALSTQPTTASAHVGFHSPGNIGCAMEQSGVRCDIRNHD